MQTLITQPLGERSGCALDPSGCRRKGRAQEQDRHRMVGEIVSD